MREQRPGRRKPDDEKSRGARAAAPASAADVRPGCPEPTRAAMGAWILTRYPSCQIVVCLVVVVLYYINRGWNAEFDQIQMRKSLPVEAAQHLADLQTQILTEIKPDKPGQLKWSGKNDSNSESCCNNCLTCVFQIYPSIKCSITSITF